MYYASRFIAGVGFMCLFLLLAVLSIDALEYETTGQCTDCVLLHKVSPVVSRNTP